MESELNYFIVIPAPVLLDVKLSPSAKLLYGEISGLCRSKGYCWATNSFFQDLHNCSVRAIQGYFKELEQAGHIYIDLERGQDGTLRKIYLSIAIPGGVQKYAGGGMQNPAPPGMQNPAGGHAQNCGHNNIMNNKGVNSISSLTDVKEVSEDPLPSENEKQDSPPAPPLPDTGKKAGKAGKKQKKEKGWLPDQGQAPQPVKGGKGVFQLFMDEYYEWFKKRNDNIPPKIDGQGGKAAKSILTYLRVIVKTKAEIDKRVLDDAGIDQQIIFSWKYVLNGWGDIEPFYQDKTRLSDINSNIQIIINQIKNGHRKKHQKSGAITATDLQRNIQSIHDKTNRSNQP